jgi:serine protease AprX
MKHNLPKLLIIAFLFCQQLCTAQNKYWVFFSNKQGVKFDPYSYFDAKAIKKHIEQGIPLTDSTDFPLNEGYVKALHSLAREITFQSRWMNAVSVITDSTQIVKIRKLPFVILAVQCREPKSKPASSPYKTTLNIKESELLIRQTGTMGDSLFRKKGIDGSGVRIAVFDAGFPDVDKSPVFEHLIKGRKIIKTWDFVKKREFVYGYNPHGTMVLSCIAGMADNQPIGLATGAEFLLARTEINREVFSEEENWLAAVEWANQNGADIISSSLGYTYNRYFTTDMNGHKSLVSRAASMAASKGILVVTAMGNDGDNSWEVLCTPADADSVLSIGGINPDDGFHIYFSSFGPTADGRMKPNVSAFGAAIVSAPNRLKKVFGTSFSTPLVAGFAACAWQTNRTLTNMQLFSEIEKSGNLYPYYDYAHGYGTPQASYFLNIVNTDTSKYLSVVNEDEYLKIRINFDEYNQQPHTQKPLLYYHIENMQGRLEKYAVIEVNSPDPLQIPLFNFKEDKIIRVYFSGKTLTYYYEAKNEENTNDHRPSANN